MNIIRVYMKSSLRTVWDINNAYLDIMRLTFARATTYFIWYKYAISIICSQYTIKTQICIISTNQHGKYLTTTKKPKNKEWGAWTLTSISSVCQSIPCQILQKWKTLEIEFLHHTTMQHINSVKIWRPIKFLTISPIALLL